MLLITRFGALDWGIVVAFFAFTTWLGARLAGKQATMRDFFLGGRQLPWYAVAGSIVSTEISAVTFVSVPSVVYKAGGDLTYLQFGLIGSFLARILVGVFLVPAYFKREIYSPYDYMGNHLGNGVRKVASAMFAVGGLLAQSSRIYLTALVLEMVLGPDILGPLSERTGLGTLELSIWTLGILSIAWTLVGGMATVIWTDVILFFVFLIGVLAALFIVVHRLDGGMTELIDAGAAAGKFRMLDFSTDPTREYTFWAALIAVTWWNTGTYGTDQLMAQRLFCCREPKSARWAMITSQVGQVITVLVMVLGIGLYAFYRQHPLSGDALAQATEKPDRIFPLFILSEVPSGISGLIVAGILAAAISGIDSIMAALSQTAMATIYQPMRLRKLKARGLDAPDATEERHQVFVGRVLVVVAGILLCLVAQSMETVARNYRSILDLALSLAGYTTGGMFAGFLLAFLPLKRDGFGFLWSAPLSVLLVFALVWHPDPAEHLPLLKQWKFMLCAIGGIVLLATWIASARRARAGLPWWLRTVALVAGIALVLWAQQRGYFARTNPAGAPVAVSLAFPWLPPIGCVVALLWAVLLGNRTASSAARPAADDATAATLHQR